VNERSAFEQTLLGLLCEGPRHGYDLAAHFAPGGDLSAVGHLARSQLYALLQALKAEGLARETVRRGQRGAARKVFEVTDQGRARFEAWVHRPVESVRGLRVELLLKLYLLGRLGLPGRTALLDAQADVLRHRLAGLRAEAPAGGGVGPWVRGLQEELLEAGLRWLARIREAAPPTASPPEDRETSAPPEPNFLPARVTAVETHGGTARVDLAAEAGRLAALLPRETLAGLHLVPGSRVRVRLMSAGLLLERDRLMDP
jgi:DNA-binding PadR family transcriptional regulator